LKLHKQHIIFLTEPYHRLSILHKRPEPSLRLAFFAHSGFFADELSAFYPKKPGIFSDRLSEETAS